MTEIGVGDLIKVTSILKDGSIVYTGRVQCIYDDGGEVAYLTSGYYAPLIGEGVTVEILKKTPKPKTPGQILYENFQVHSPSYKMDWKDTNETTFKQVWEKTAKDFLASQKSA